ncbi:MAG: 1-acyl-sn-glycerol-3-phosphate acyltransferase [Bacteroidetes bacterium]|nr:1-acyl-sn-glycerol-3-phosphate acyltransferase [Bacteroidota bacterium]
MIKKIDLDEVIAGKNPKLAKRMPRFVKSYLKRILHIAEMNTFLEEHYEKEGLEFANAVISFLDLKLNVVGEENFVNVERPLFVSNHPLGGLDGIAILTLTGKHYDGIKLMVNDFLMAVTNLNSMFVPVNKHGSSRAYKNDIDKSASADSPLIVFPAGVCSRKLPYGIFDLEWNKSFIKIARSNERIIVPIYVAGRNSRFFYNLANLRKRLHIKGNIEMLYLVDEMVKQKHLTLNIVVGKPIEHTVFTSKHDDWVWARHVREMVYDMRDGKPHTFDPNAELKLPESYFG